MSNDQEKDLAVIQKALDILGEHFDTSHIFVTRHDPAIADGTVAASLGSGNWYARYGQIQEWMTKRQGEFIRGTI